MKSTTWTWIPLILPIASCLPSLQQRETAVNQTTCNGRTYAYDELAGYGFVPSNARDKFGDTIGGPSSLAFVPSSWKSTGEGTYEGVFWGLPDRGWNTQGTLNYQNRINKFAVSLTLAPNASVSRPSSANVQFTYLDTILLTGPDGKPTTGLRADVKAPYLTYPGFPVLPSATYIGNGFGQAGEGDRRISIDTEGLVLGKDNSFWISDEYGPYIYHFSAEGKMLQAIPPPDAYLPRRNGSLSFASNDPPIYAPDDKVIPEAVESGRANNQGVEGLTLSDDGKTLYALMQSALAQDGGTGNPRRKQARLRSYKINGGGAASYEASYVVTLPVFNGGKTVAAQSEILSLGHDQFFVLARDSGRGHGQDNSESRYRQADVFDISRATDIKRAQYDDSATAAIADAQGVLKAGITPAEYCPFLDFNVNSELGKFGLHNGGAQDQGLLNEKWEALALVPVEAEGKNGKSKGKKKGKKGGGAEYFLFAFSDNDFVTQNGYVNFGELPYSDKSGFNLDLQALVFRLTFS